MTRKIRPEVIVIIISIFVSTFVLIGGFILLQDAPEVIVAQDNDESSDKTEKHSLQKNNDFRPVDVDSDNIRGNQEATITIVEYSDFECPFCATFHQNLKKLVNERSDVNWVFRNFPLPGHANAESAAYAGVCVRSLAGNDAFWEFADRLFLNQSVFSQSLYDSFASDLGIDTQEFADCMLASNTHNLVSDDFDESVTLGGRGTPFSVVLTSDGRGIPISGALPYDQLSAFIDQLVAN